MNSFSSVQGEEALRQYRTPALGHRDANECASALVAGDVAAVSQSFAAAPTWEDRWFCLEHLARLGSDSNSAAIEPSLIDAWVDGWPDHPVPLLIRAAIAAFAGQDASSDLDRVAAVEPANPLVHGLAVVARAGSGIGDVEASLGEMLAIEALYEPHVHFLRSSSPSSGGDIASTIEFATSVDDLVPVGSPLRAMVPLAAVELVLSEQPDDHLAMLKDLGLCSRIMMAAGQSVFHPTFVGPPSIPGIKATTAFMVALVLLGEDDLSLNLHRRLDGVFADWPFSLLAPPSVPSWMQIGRHMEERAPAAALAGERR